MVFISPSWVPKLPGQFPICFQTTDARANYCFNTAPPSNVPIHEFMLSDTYRGVSASKSRNPFTCGISGKSYTYAEVSERVEYLSRALHKELGFFPNEGTEWDKVIGIFALNTVWSSIVIFCTGCFLILLYR